MLKGQIYLLSCHLWRQIFLSEDFFTMEFVAGGKHQKHLKI